MIKVAVCIDKNGGIMFNNRRVSQDSKVREKLLSLTGKHNLFLNTYSSTQFEQNQKICITDTFLSEASHNDICFVENINFDINAVEELYIFNWNRKYPADQYFNFDPIKNGFIRIKKEEFKGSSHDKITLEIFRRNKK